ncbi:MAG: WG repeat-containing protein [Coprothermobacterota bacterium]|nr:WG repeat-containing protein [Coprothermobacterota bacterium]
MPQFDFALQFSEGLAAVETGGKQWNFKWGYIDMEGKFQIAPQFEGAGSFLKAWPCDGG